MAYKLALQVKAVTSTAAFMGVKKDLGFIRFVGRLDGWRSYRRVKKGMVYHLPTFSGSIS